MKKVIVNFGNGPIRYVQGSQRLMETALSKGGMKLCEMMCTADYPYGCPTHQKSPYAFKPFMFKKAKEQGADMVLWIDSNVYVSADLKPVWDIIEKRGYFFVHNGFNCAQTLTDNALKNLNITRDEAEKLEELTGCVMGLNFNDPQAGQFLDWWLERATDGTFVGDTHHNSSDSRDPRFLFSRHDQPVASVIAHKLGMTKWESPGTNFQYWSEVMADTICLVNRGL